MAIQWFPGHMKKALDGVKKVLPLIDLCIEILDARIPASSSNALLEKITERKPRLLLLNKKDMADPRETEKWVQAYRAQGHQALAIDALDQGEANRILADCQALMKASEKNQRQADRFEHELRCLVFGIPNSGKSTVINLLAGRRSAKVGNRPGITTGQQWIKTKSSLVLMDTPGVLWHKFEGDQALHLAFTGAIRDEILPVQDIGYAFLRLLQSRNPDVIQDRYGISPQEDPVRIMEHIAQSIGALYKGGEADYDRVSRRILDDFRKLRLGRVSLERVDTKF